MACRVPCRFPRCSCMGIDWSLVQMLIVGVFALAMIIGSVLHAMAGDLPDPSKTPGVINPKLTQALVCSKSFRTGPYRHVTPAMHKQIYALYGLTPNKAPCPCEDDHLISIELGGSNDNRNRWPQSYISKPWNAHIKDKLEGRLHRLVCAKKLTLQEAQQAISSNWIEAYQKFIGDATP